MKKLTWLHLSDWHQKGSDFDRKVVCDALIKDIQGRKHINDNLEQVDFVIFSGDLAYYGLPDEYEAARTNLLDPVLNAVGLKSDQLFIVPGNHDLSRNHIYKMLPPELQQPLDTHDKVKEWLTDDDLRKRLLEPFKSYNSFVAGYTSQSSPDYASILRFDAGGKHIALLGLNSAWMCARNKNENGEVNDARYLLVGEPQIHDALAQIIDADIRIAVLQLM